MKSRKVLENIIPYEVQNRKNNGYIYMNHNENLLGCSEKVMDAFGDIKSKSISNYPSYRNLNTSICDKYKINLNQLLVTNGGDEAIRYVMDAFVEKDEKVIMTDPVFEMYSQYSTLREANIIQVPLTLDYEFPFNVFQKQVKGCKLAILVNPNTPTGMEIDREKIEWLLNSFKETMFILDEAYTEFRKKSDMDLINKYKNLIVIRSLSKAYGLAGIRLGFLAASSDLIDDLKKVSAPYSVNSIATKLGIEAINDWKFLRFSVNEIEKGREFLTDNLSKLGFKVLPSRSNFVAFYGGGDCEKICDCLRKSGIIIKNLSNMKKMEGWLRITVGNELQNKLLIDTLNQNFKLESIIFDMDGVLVDVSESYTQAIIKTVKYFTNKLINTVEINNLKNKGNFNCDWKLTRKLIQNAGIEIDLERVIKVFQTFYLGDGEKFKGLIENEKWLASKTILQKLTPKLKLGIVTDRPGEEALIALKRAKVDEYFDCLITRKETGGLTKPNPLGINLALKNLNVKRAIYIGDNIDDMKAASRCGISSIGLARGNGENLLNAGAFKNISRLSTLVGMFL